jgi:2-dehydro-3-deoxygalactonokinase
LSLLQGQPSSNIWRLNPCAIQGKHWRKLKAPLQFLSCDWGTSQFRLRLVQGPDWEVRAELATEDGVARLASASEGQNRAQAFHARLEANLRALAEQSRDWPKAAPVVISGMASSTIGWHELPYARLPFSLQGTDLVWEEVEPTDVRESKHRVILLSGVCSDWEIMRGEESQLLGLASLRSGESLQNEAVVLLPGTHSKHAHIRSGALIRFDTYLTGELFQVLSQHSVLRHSVSDRERHAAAGQAMDASERSAFVEAVQLGLSGSLLQYLFRVRTRQVLHGVEAAVNRAFLSGLLIGSEIGSLVRSFPTSVPVILCGGEHLTERYELACQTAGLTQRLAVVQTQEAQLLTARGQARFLERVLDL